MQLTNEQIKFIDTYLENSGVEYIDIRVEITDHVAAALEEQQGDFYENFKKYMLHHKKELLNSNSKFVKLAGRRAMKLLVISLFKPLTLITFILLLITSRMVYHYLGEEAFTDAVSSGFLLFSLCFILFSKIYYRSFKIKFSVVDKLQAILPTSLYIILFIVQPQRIIEDTAILITFYSFFTAVMISSFTGYNRLIREYKLQFDGK